MNSKLVYLDASTEISKRIASGKYPVGSRLPTERELAEDLMISRNSLREALRLLEQQKMIQSNPGGSRYVMREQPITEETDSLYGQLENAAVADLLEAREYLDDILLPLACQRGTKEDMEEIDLAYAKMTEVTHSDGVSLDAGDLLHLSIAKAAHNNVFISIYTANLEIFQQIRATTFRMPGRRKEMLQEHTNIYLAIKERDDLAARYAARIHLRNIRRCYKSIQDKSLVELRGW